MNKVMLIGNLTRDPEVRYTTGTDSQAVARFTIAVNRKAKRGEEKKADFIPCVAFGRQGEFVEKWFKQGSAILVIGRLQTGSYVNREDKKVFTTDVVVEEVEFVRSEVREQAESNPMGAGKELHSNRRETQESGFYDVEEEGLPFN